MFHANPYVFKETDKPNPYKKELTAKEIWEQDKIKIDIVKNKSYDVFIIWENDYKISKEQEINKCLKFLNLINE